LWSTLKIFGTSFNSRNHPFNSRNSPVIILVTYPLGAPGFKMIEFKSSKQITQEFSHSKTKVVSIFFNNSVSGHFSEKWIASDHPSNHTGSNVTGLMSVWCPGAESIAQARPNRGLRATAGSWRPFPWLATDFANILQSDLNMFLKNYKSSWNIWNAIYTASLILLLYYSWLWNWNAMSCIER